jgi:GDP-4-dehydro-6-deoxy-D-mannose reductase
MSRSLKSEKNTDIFSKVVVLGSTSYIAGYFTDLLKADPTANVLEFNRGSHPHLFDQESRGPALEKLFRDLNPTLIVNFVGVVNESLDRCMEWNCYFPRDILRAARNSSPGAKILLLGSAAEYGLRDDPTPIPETSSLLGTTPYALSKIAQSQLLQETEFELLSILYARVFNVWGTGMRDGTLPGRLNREILQWEAASNPIVVHDSNSIRDYISVENLVRDLVSTCANFENSTIVNFGSGQGITVRAFCEMFFESGENPRGVLLSFLETPMATNSVAEVAKLMAIRAVG